MLLLGLGLTALLSWRAHAMALNRRELQLEIAATQLASVIQARTDIYIALLRSAGAILRDRPARMPEEFREFVAALELERNYPGIQGLGFARRVEPAGVAALEARMRARGRPDFRVWPDVTGPVGYSIVLLEPEDRRNQAAIGFDMYAEPIRRAAMERAARTGQPAASGKVTLVQEIDDDKQAGFLIYVPVYDEGSPEGELLGFSYSPFRGADLFRGIVGGRPDDGVDFAVFDGEPRPENELYRSSEAPIAGKGQPLRQHRLEVAGRAWTLLFAEGAVVGTRAGTGGWFALAGLLVSTLLYLLVRHLDQARAETERSAMALRASEQVALDNQRRMQAVFDAAFDAILTIDERGRISEMNRAAEQLFGRTRESTVGRKFAEVVFPERLQTDFAAGAGRRPAAGTHRLLGRRVELTGRRADGTEFPIELSLSRVEGGTAVRFTAFIRDITDRLEATARIQELADSLERRVRARTAALEDANRQLEAFSYSVSHDLRAPARHVLGYAELLRKQLTGWADPSAQRLVRVITDSASRMAHLIDDLLAFSRTSRQQLRRQKVEMQPLVEETIRSLAPEIGNRRIDWHLDLLPAVEGDRSLLAQVWTNLLSNAVKYTRPREVATIHLRAETGPDETIFHVTDNGTGFDMRYVRKLFGVFSRLHREDEFEGTGIGLANVARIVQRHGGRVWAQGEVNIGATFSFSLPKASPQPPDDEPGTRPPSSHDPWKVADDAPPA